MPAAPAEPFAAHFMIPMRRFVLHFQHPGTPGARARPPGPPRDGSTAPPAEPPTDELPDRRMREIDVQKLVDAALAQAEQAGRLGEAARSEAAKGKTGRDAVQRWSELGRAWREAAGGAPATDSSPAAAAGDHEQSDENWLEVGDDAPFSPPASAGPTTLPSPPALPAPPALPPSAPSPAAAAAAAQPAPAAPAAPAATVTHPSPGLPIPPAATGGPVAPPTAATAALSPPAVSHRAARAGETAAATHRDTAGTKQPDAAGGRRPTEGAADEEASIVAKGLAAPVRQGDRLLGQVTAQVSCGAVLRAVLKQARRDAGEVPFAVSAGGHLYTIDEADRARLAPLSVALRGGAGAGGAGPEARRIIGDWVVVTSFDPVTGLTFGIARPIGGALHEVRRTAARNFGAGVGLIGLALLGILPLSGGMTRSLRLVTDGADRIARGDLAVRVPVRSASELGQLAAAFNRMAEDLSENQRRLVEQELGERLLRSEFERKTAELEEARRFQLALLPHQLPEHPDFAVAVTMRTATEVGGDYFDFHLAPAGPLTVAIGDATGHGATAGTMVVAIKSLLSADFASGGLSEFLGGASRAVRRMDLGRMAMALALARLEPGALTVSSAGMPPVLVYRHASGEVEEIALPGLPLGSMASSYQERRVPVAAGDTILLASDGLAELANPDGDPLGYARVRTLLAGCGGQPPAEVIAALSAAADAWRGARPLADDLTLVAIQVRG
jgi:serine phosphatase RsbU (regulator of sigma subunit)